MWPAASAPINSQAFLKPNRTRFRGAGTYPNPHLGRVTWQCGADPDPKLAGSKPIRTRGLQIIITHHARAGLPVAARAHAQQGLPLVISGKPPRGPLQGVRDMPQQGGGGLLLFAQIRTVSSF